MDVGKVLHMKAGNDEASYGETAHMARRALTMTKTVRKEAMKAYCDRQFKGTTLCVADLGCASGPNTFNAVSDLIMASEEVRRNSNDIRNGAQDIIEYQVLLNDLLGNDFNNVFKSLPEFHQSIRKQVGDVRCFVAGVAGSFHGRLFPTQSLHFVHASYSLHWLSQIPKGLKGNKRNIYLTKTSPQKVIEAYQKHFQKDMASFLSSRSQEVVNGGRMVLTFCSRFTDDPIEECYGLDMLGTALNKLVDEGMIEEEKLESFNMPVYHASAREIEDLVKKDGSFMIDTIDIVQGKLLKGEEPTGEIKAVLESLFASQFGEEVIDEIFTRFNKDIQEAICKGKVFFPHVTISLIRK